MFTQHNSHVIDSLSSISVPTLIDAGAADKPFLKATDYMAAKIPGAQKAIIVAAGHAANMDQPSCLNAALGDFLQNLKQLDKGRIQ